jgi:uncharacterized membrane protein
MKTWNRLEKGLFIAFLIWSAAGLIFTLLHISVETIARWPLSGWLRHFVNLCLGAGDPILIVLAFANTHLHAARQWSASCARRWGLHMLVGSLAVETMGACTGFPFGSYYYTGNFGPLLGVVPMTIPLAWYVVVTNSLFLVRAVIPHGSRWIEAALTGLLCMLYDFVLEPFATGVKQYWIWTNGTIPPQNYAAWLILSGLLVRFFAPTASTRFPRDPRPAVILTVTLLIFLAGEAMYASIK